MCKWGTTTKVKLYKAKLKTRKMEAYVDSCIAPIIEALNNAGIRTLASCCGHRNIPGSVVLEDGRELVIFPNYGSARKFFNKLGKDIQGNEKN